MTKLQTRLVLLVFLIPSLKAQKTHFQDKNQISNELSEEQKSRLSERKTEDSDEKNENILDDESRSSQKEKIEQRANLKDGKSRPTYPIQTDDDHKQSAIENSKSNELKQKTIQPQIKSENPVEDSESNQNSSEHSNQNSDLAEDRPSLDDEVTTEHYKPRNENTTPSQPEQKTEPQSDSDFIDTRPNLDDQKPSVHTSDTDLVDTRPILDEDKAEQNRNVIEDSKSQDEQKTTSRSNKQNLNKNRKVNSKLKIFKRRFEEKKPDKTRSGHVKYTMVTDHDFAYMAAVVKGSRYVCAGALIDESWVLTAAGGVHSMRETIRFLRIRMGSINFKKGGTLLPIKYLETHPYYNVSKPDYDLALLMLSEPVRYTVNIRSIRLQLAPKEVTATHFILTTWHGALKPGKKSIAEAKHDRMLSVAHLHPSDPEECREELRDIGAGHDGIVCLDGGTEPCMRDTGAPIVMNGVLWGVVSSWKPSDCDDVDSSAFATLISTKNSSTWVHATVHGHRWLPE